MERGNRAARAMSIVPVPTIMSAIERHVQCVSALTGLVAWLILERVDAYVWAGADRRPEPHSASLDRRPSYRLPAGARAPRAPCRTSFPCPDPEATAAPPSHRAAGFRLTRPSEIEPAARHPGCEFAAALKSVPAARRRSISESPDRKGRFRRLATLGSLRTSTPNAGAYGSFLRYSARSWLNGDCGSGRASCARTSSSAGHFGVRSSPSIVRLCGRTPSSSRFSA